MDSVTFHVSGYPAPKGSFTRMPNGAMLPAGTTASREKGINWRNEIRHVALDTMGDNQPQRGAVRLMVEFQLPYPKSSIRKYQYGWWPHIKKPDVDKLLRMLLDALTGIVWADDSQVAYVTVNKVYAWNDRPGAYIVIDFLGDDSLQSLAASQRTVINAIESL